MGRSGERRVHSRVAWLVGAVVLLVGVAGVAGVAGVVVWRLLSPGSPYEQALATVPASTLRATYTSWGQVRSQASGEGLTAASRERVQAFLDRAYERDLTSTSGVVESTSALADLYGFSPLDAEWELLAQSPDGQVDVMRVGDDVDLGDVEDRLRKLGYTPPSGDSAVWTGGPDLVAGISGALSPLQQHLAVLPDQGLVLMSDNSDYLESAAKVAGGDGETALDDEGAASLARVASAQDDGPTNAVQWMDSFGCEDLAMGAADAEDQRVAEQLVADAGDVSPVADLVMAQQPDRSLVVGLHFELAERASANLQSRVDLASGDAPGQGGSFRDRFTVTDGRADGRDVVLTLEPKDDQPVLSDLSSGPVLFATC